MVEHERVRHLLREDRRDVHRDPERRRQPPSQAPQCPQQRQIALQHRLVEPLLAVGPTPREAAVGHVAVENERHRTCRHAGILYAQRARPVSYGPFSAGWPGVTRTAYPAGPPCGGWTVPL